MPAVNVLKLYGNSKKNKKAHLLVNKATIES